MKETATFNKAQAAAAAFADERLRWLVGKGDVLVQRGELTENRLKELLQKTVRDEIERNFIMIQLDEGPATVSEIAKATKMEKHIVLSHLLALMKWNRVSITGEEKREYLYSRKTI
ncbi:MAG: ArsR family transcriptional regulator [Promethearchaeota archaeon]